MKSTNLGEEAMVDKPEAADHRVLPQLGSGLRRHPGIIPGRRDGTGSRSLLEWPERAGVAQLVEHIIRNDGVPGSSPGVGLPPVGRRASNHPHGLGSTEVRSQEELDQVRQ